MYVYLTVGAVSPPIPEARKLSLSRLHAFVSYPAAAWAFCFSSLLL